MCRSVINNPDGRRELEVRVALSRKRSGMGIDMKYRLYEKNEEKELSDQLFLNPTSEYRGAPFWAWNTRPDRQLMESQMEAFGQMGFGGFHIHSRTGLDVPYLGDEFMEDVLFCVKYAASHQMLAWAYDEDRFPSGFGGGLVTCEKKYRYRELLWTPRELPDVQKCRPQEKACESYLIGIYDIQLDEAGYLASYEKISDPGEARGDVWFAYLRVASPDSWFNNQTYVDTLDPAAIARFCQVTHERYREVVGEYFGKVIPSFFTDEPKTTYKKTLPLAKSRQNLIMPWTDDFPDTFRQRYRMDLVEKLPELFWQLPGNEVSVVRYDYHRHVAERFLESYSTTIGNWCDKNGVSLTGHMIKEPSLKSQSTAVGESMAPLGPFGFPGIDMLCDDREYTTAKQAQSITHQFGREAMLSELYGVTNWDFDFRRHKVGGDWQAALGVTIRVPHLSWMTMEGEAKRDYPASIHYQSPWYREYRLIEDHFARVHTAMTRGKAVVRIGVIHPVESYWCFWGPEEQTAGIRKQMDEQFQQLTEWLLFDHLDFDFISESVLGQMNEIREGRLQVGASAYDAVLVPGNITLRSTTVDVLGAFAAAGGRIIFLSQIPRLEEGKPSDRMEALYRKSEGSGAMSLIPYEKYRIFESLSPYREVKLTDPSGNTCNKHLYQLRQDGDCRWLFVAYGKKKPRYDCESAGRMQIRVRGIWYPVFYDTVTGQIKSCRFSHEKDWTVIQQEYNVHDSMLFQLRKTPRILPEETKEPVSGTAVLKTDPNHVPVTLEEPNVALLDMAEYRVDQGAYNPAEEVLRIGQKLREAFGYEPQGGRMAQPWTMEKKPPEHELTLRFLVESEIEIEGAALALEQADLASVTVNGQPVLTPDSSAEEQDWYVDRKIRTRKLPPLKKGINEICITVPFGENANLENAFLLGAFGVRAEGSRYVLTRMPDAVAFGDLTHQGFPFYGGNLSYQLQVDAPEGDLAVRVPYFRGALIGVSIDGQREGSIAFAPYGFEKKGLTSGRHQVTLTLFGNRINTFGALHNCNENTTWFGPDAWRSSGDSYSREYQLKRTGILKCPEVK